MAYFVKVHFCENIFYLNMLLLHTIYLFLSKLILAEIWYEPMALNSGGMSVHYNVSFQNDIAFNINYWYFFDLYKENTFEFK